MTWLQRKLKCHKKIESKTRDEEKERKIERKRVEMV